MTTERPRPVRRPDLISPRIVLGPPGRPPGVRQAGPDGIAVALIASAIALTAGLLIGATLTGPIDENTKDVLVAGIGGLLGLLTGVSVAFLGFRNTRAADRERNRREDRYRFATDKQAAFARLLGVGDAARTSAETAANDPRQQNVDLAAGNNDQLSAAQEVAALLGARQVDEAVSEYVEALTAYFNLMLELSDETAAQRRKSMQPSGRWEVAQDLVFDRRLKTIEAMRVDLGLARGELH